MHVFCAERTPYVVLIEVSVACYQPSCQVFPHRNSLETCGRQDFAAALGTNDSLSETDFSDIITVIEGFLVTK